MAAYRRHPQRVWTFKSEIECGIKLVLSSSQLIQSNGLAQRETRTDGSVKRATLAVVVVNEHRLATGGIPRNRRPSSDRRSGNSRQVEIVLLLSFDQ